MRRNYVLPSILLTLGLLVGIALLANKTQAASSRSEAVVSESVMADTTTSAGDVASFTEPPFTDADYWAFADLIQPTMDRLWNEKEGTYSFDARINSAALITHSVAALKGHVGPSRQDDRARRLALALCQSPPYLPRKEGQSPGSTNPQSPSQVHRPGFVASMNQKASQQHISIDPKIVKALAYTYRARKILNLSPDLVQLIKRRIKSVSHSRFFVTLIFV